MIKVDAAASRDEGLPESVPRVAKRRDRPDPGDDDSPLLQNVLGYDDPPPGPCPPVEETAGRARGRSEDAPLPTGTGPARSVSRHAAGARHDRLSRLLSPDRRALRADRQRARRAAALLLRQRTGGDRGTAGDQRPRLRQRPRHPAARALARERLAHQQRRAPLAPAAAGAAGLPPRTDRGLRRDDGRAGGAVRDRPRAGPHARDGRHDVAADAGHRRRNAVWGRHGPGRRHDRPGPPRGDAEFPDLVDPDRRAARSSADGPDRAPLSGRAGAARCGNLPFDRCPPRRGPPLRRRRAARRAGDAAGRGRRRGRHGRRADPRRNDDDLPGRARNDGPRADLDLVAAGPASRDRGPAAGGTGRGSRRAAARLRRRPRTCATPAT